MSFQAYLDAIESKTGKTPQQLVDEAHAKGFGADTKSGEIVAWLADDYGLGRGHAMALVHVVKNGPGISDKHVGSTGTHRDESDVLRLDGIAHRDQPGTLTDAETGLECGLVAGEPFALRPRWPGAAGRTPAPRRGRARAGPPPRAGS